MKFEKDPLFYFWALTIIIFISLKIRTVNFFLFWRTSVLFGSHWYPSFGLLVMSDPGFKARVDPLLACFLICMQWNPQIHFWCDTCWLYSSQHDSRAFWTHTLENTSTSIGGAQTHDRACRNKRLVTIRPGHSKISHNFTHCFSCLKCLQTCKICMYTLTGSVNLSEAEELMAKLLRYGCWTGFCKKEIEKYVCQTLSEDKKLCEF